MTLALSTSRHVGFTPAEWIAAADAAPLLDVSADHLARECRSRLAPRGLAQQVTPREGGKPKWYLHRSYDPRLAFDVTGELPDLTSFTEKQRRQAFMRRACVMAFRERKDRDRRPVKAWLPDLLAELSAKHGRKIGQTSLYIWHKAFSRPSDIVRLIDKRGGDKRSKGAPECWQMFRELYCDQRQPSVSQCHRQVRAYAEEKGLEWCSLSSCRNQLDKRIPPEQQLYNRDPEAWKRQCAPYIPQRKDRYDPGEAWVGDHCQLDFWVRAGKRVFRPWLTAWQDWRTRRIVGYTLAESPNSDTILSALRMGIKDVANGGPPTAVIIDNGRDYTSFSFHGVTKKQRREAAAADAESLDEDQFKGLLGMAGVEDVSLTLAYNADGKARMERAFRTIHEQFDVTFTTYCGRDSSRKPQNLKRILKERRNVPAFDHVRQRFGDFIKALNTNANHNIADLIDDAGERISPDQAMARRKVIRRLPDECVLDLMCQHWHKPVTVQKHGVAISPDGVTLAYGMCDSALIPHKSAAHAARRKQQSPPRVYVSFDPEDLRTVRIWDEHFRYICTAKQNEFGGLDRKVGRDEIRDLMREKRQRIKALKITQSTSQHEYLTAGELVADKLRQPVEPATDAIAIVDTPMAGQGAEVRETERRKAAGAEHMARVGDAAMDKLVKQFANDPLPTPPSKGRFRPRPGLLDRMREANKQQVYQRLADRLKREAEGDDELIQQMNAQFGKIGKGGVYIDNDDDDQPVDVQALAGNLNTTGGGGDQGDITGDTSTNGGSP